MEERSITQKKYNVWENLFASEKYFKRVFFMVGLMIGKPCGIYDFQAATVLEAVICNAS